MSRGTRTVGIIAEDDSDVDTIVVLMKRIASNDHIAVKKSVGEGCGKVRRKCNAWSNGLKARGCSLLIVLHDLDNNNLTKLMAEIRKNLEPCPIAHHLICIPVQELEAWLLSDPQAVQSALHLLSAPKVNVPPETIDHAKEHLGELVSRTSLKTVIYINTRHNSKIAEKLSIQTVLNRCPSFIPFHDFVRAHIKSRNN